MRTGWIVVLAIILAISSVWSQTVKIATYNIFFLDDGISEIRQVNLQQVIEELNADIIGFQEIESVAALSNILGPEYQMAMLDDPQEFLEVALAARAPFKIVSKEYIYVNPELEMEFPYERNLLHVVLEGHGHTFHVLVHHAKSRRGGRDDTDFRRENAARLILKYIKLDLAGEKVMLLGDFNDNPDDRSLNILEYGSPQAQAGIDEQPDSFLFNSTEPLVEKDYCSYGYNYFYQDSAVGDTFNPAIPGSREENNKWRDKEHDYMEDVKIKAILFDQILLSMNLKKYFQKSGVFHQSVAIKGERSDIDFRGGNVVYTHRGSLASDHVPVWTILNLQEESGN